MGSPTAKFKVFMQASLVYFRTLWFTWLTKLVVPSPCPVADLGQKSTLLLSWLCSLLKMLMVWVSLTIPPGYNMIHLHSKGGGLSECFWFLPWCWCPS
jgi:hypothetical protein